MRNNKLIPMLLATSMAAASLTGCGSSAETAATTAAKAETAAPATQAAPAATAAPEASGEFNPRTITEGVKLTVSMPENAKVADFNTNATTLAIEEALGVDLEFITFPAADYEQKLNVMVMGGDKLPDIIFNGNTSNADWSGWIAEEVLLPLDEYYDDPNMSANIIKGGDICGVDIRSALTQADGHVYYLPKLHTNIASTVYSKVWLYQPWLDAIGKEVPTTTEEFYEVAKLICETDLNGNSKKDEVAMTGKALSNWFPCMMNAFVYSHDTEYRFVEDGKVNFAYVTDEWKEGLKYIKRFFDEGLIPQEAITQSGDQFDSHRYADEQSVFGFADWVPGTNKGLAWKNEWVAMMPLIGPEGEQNAMRRTSGLFPSAGAAITIDCENPEAAFLVCDFLCDIDFGISARYGEQGVNWDYWENAQESLINGTRADYQVDDTYAVQFIAYDDNTFWGSNEPQDNCWLQQGCYILPPNSLAVKTTNLSEDETLILEFNQYYNEIVAELLKYGPEEIVDSAPLTTDESAAIADAKALLKDYVKESIGAFLTGAWDIDAKWDEYLAELEKMGYKQVLEAYQTGYDRTH